MMARRFLHLEAFGVPFTVRIADASLVPALEPMLPPGSAPAPPGGFELTLEDLAGLAELDARLRRHIATHAPGRVFVHAGVVAHRGRAIVLPAATFAGKSELVAALVRAGAVYYSDEYAVIDDDGLVHPYARPLTLRARAGRAAERLGAAQLGGRPGTDAVPIGLIAATAFAPSAGWAPEERTPAAGALLLLAHAGQARADPGRVLDALHRAALHARVLEGPRGEADVTAPALLAAMDAAG